MHWLHVKPNSDFPKIRQFFGRFLSFYRQIFVTKIEKIKKRRIGIRQSFGLFFAFFLLSANFWILENRFWPSFGRSLDCLRIFARYSAQFPEKLRKKKSFFRILEVNFGKNLPKNRGKSANFLGIRNSASRVANALQCLLTTLLRVQRSMPNFHKFSCLAYS